MKKSDTQARPSSPGAPVSGPANPPVSHSAGPRSFDKAPAGLKPVGPYFAALLANLAEPE